MLNMSNILTKQEKQLYRARTRTHILQTPGLRELIVLLCIAADAITVFSAIDLYMTQKVWLSWVITITAAFCLDVPPMLLGSCLQNKVLSNKTRVTLCICLILIFVLVFTAVFALRMATVEDMFTSTSDIGLQITTDTDEDAEAPEQEGPTAAQYIIAFLMGMLPLGTSVCSFYLGYENSTEEAVRHRKRLNMIELREEIDRCKVMRQELEQDKAFDLETYDRRRYEACINKIEQEAAYLDHRADQLLAEELGTADAVSTLVEKHKEADENQSSYSVPIPASA